MTTCPDCGERVYNLGCVNCNEIAYIEEQEALDALYESATPRNAEAPPSEAAASVGAQDSSSSSEIQ